jgi:hypothetical protein
LVASRDSPRADRRAYVATAAGHKCVLHHVAFKVVASFRIGLIEQLGQFTKPLDWAYKRRYIHRNRSNLF